MPLSPEQEWTLVACGLVAHADGILEVGEWDQVLYMLDDRVADDEATQWLALLSDAAALRKRFDLLQPPAPFLCEDILARAWRMALADGHGSDEEAAVLAEVAERLGVPASDVGELREQWLAQAQRRSEIVAGFAVIVATLDDRMDTMEIAEYDLLLDRLPLAEGRIDAMRALLDAPPELDVLVGQLLALPSEERGIALLSLVPLVHATSGGAPERALFVDIAERLALPPGDAEAMLSR
ncbi:MAG: TerB family tellurite resistance protein [Nannocystaceae bacterium]|nr:TerB family tellurite resistance protein [Nannocystaceae bacterium]